MLKARRAAFGIAVLVLCVSLTDRSFAAESTRKHADLRRPPAGATEFRPDPVSIIRHGPAYRYPQAGWTVLHIEGAPYERGLQHGHLMAAEIVEFIKTRAACRMRQSPDRGVARRCAHW